MLLLWFFYHSDDETPVKQLMGVVYYYSHEPFYNQNPKPLTNLPSLNKED